MAKQSHRTARTRIRPDGRKSFLAYLPTQVITDLKVAAIREGRPAYLIAEDAIRSYLTATPSLRKNRR